MLNNRYNMIALKLTLCQLERAILSQLRSNSVIE